MELKLELTKNNTAPLSGLLIKGGNPFSWASAMQSLALSPEQHPLYVLPGKAANSEWGCLIVTGIDDFPEDTAEYAPCQEIEGLLYIPEYTKIFPAIVVGELKKSLLNTPHLLHPEIGLVKLETPINWSEYLRVEAPQQKLVFPSPEPLFIPNRIRSFRIEALSPKELLDQLEQHIGTEDEPLNQRPLSMMEKAKLKILKQFFGEEARAANGDRPAEKLDGIRKMFGGEDEGWLDRLEKEYNDLEERNKKEVERLLDLLKKDPKKGLKYAIPLDERGTGRGPMGGGGGFTLSERWGSFALGRAAGSGGNGSGGIDLGDDYFRIREQYMKTAEELIRNGDFREAAFVYLKLLKNYRLAAETLERGGLYTEAASIYLKHLNDRKLAAVCYEKANNLLEAIDLYKEIKSFEKVGDLYLRMNDQEAAFLHYEMVIENHLQNNQYLKCGLLVKEKLKDLPRARELFYEGWNKDSDSFNCLNNFFNAFAEDVDFRNALRKTMKEDKLSRNQHEALVNALQVEFKKRGDTVTGEIRDTAYQVIARAAKGNPKLLQTLLSFNPEDEELSRDLTIRRGDY